MRRPDRLPWLAAGGAVAVAIAVGVYFGAIRSSNSGRSAGPVHYSVTYPKNWRRVATSSFTVDGEFAALGRTDGKGVIVMSLNGKVASLAALAKSGTVESQLQKTVPDYRSVGSYVIQLAGGRAFNVTYVRTKAKEVDRFVVLPYGGASIVFRTAAPTGNHQAAREIGAILRSFTLTP